MAITITDYKITNLLSFNSVTQEPRQVAGLYFYQILDCLVELTYQVSLDFDDRPQLYKNLGGTPGQGVKPSQPSALTQNLASVHAQYGTRIDLPSKDQRRRI